MSAYVTKSPWVVHYDGSSCNGCDIEVLACLTPMYDVERFGIINCGNPKHADVFLVTGSVNEQNKNVVKQIYEQMPEPKVVVAIGICACSGGIFKDCYNILGGVDQVIPVDAYVPGCAARPEAIIDAVVKGLDILKAKREAMERGELPLHSGKPVDEEETAAEDTAAAEETAAETTDTGEDKEKAVESKTDSDDKAADKKEADKAGKDAEAKEEDKKEDAKAEKDVPPVFTETGTNTMPDCDKPESSEEKAEDKADNKDKEADDKSDESSDKKAAEKKDEETDDKSEKSSDEEADDKEDKEDKEADDKSDESSDDK